MKHVVLAFCSDLQQDPVSRKILDRVISLEKFDEINLLMDGHPVLRRQTSGVLYDIVRLDFVLSLAYGRYADFFNENFGSANVIISINKHEGQKAPPAIFTVQTTGDMATGNFSPVCPQVTRGLFLAVEEQRQRVALADFSTWMEATHWSGSIFGNQTGSMVAALGPSVIDLEIGSYPSDWSNSLAIEVIAQAIFHIFDDARMPVLSLFCIGGTHFEQGFTQLIREYGSTQRIALSHILPNHWLISNQYDDPRRLADLLTCARSIEGGVDAIVFHDNLKAAIKEQVRCLARELGVPALSHRRFRTPDIRGLLCSASA